MFSLARVSRVFEAINEDVLSDRSGRLTTGLRPAITLLIASLCLLLIHYLKFDATYFRFLEWLGHFQKEFVDSLKLSQYRFLYIQVWWWLWHAIGYVLIPCLAIKFIFRDSVRDYGLSLGRTRQYLGWCLLLATPIICFAFIVSFREDFSSHYPFYRLVHRSMLDLLLWELIYLSQFIFLEFFFRGFMLHSLQRQFGVNAIFIMSLPYLMIHFSKPWLEAGGAIFFGILLGILAIRSRSIWGGAMVHMSIALSMDLLALWQTGRIPVRFLP